MLMIPSISLQNILLQIEQLDYVSKIRLLQAVLEMLKIAELPTVTTSLLSLQGLGCSVWTDVNIDEYVANERNLWD